MADRGRNFNETIDLTNKALEWAPFDWQLYFYRALAEVAIHQPSNAIDDFRRARFLEPNSYEIPLAEGKAWLSSQPILAVTAWREALRKAGPQRSEVYASMLTSASLHNPEVNRILEEVGLSQPDLALAYLGRLSGPAFPQASSSCYKRNRISTCSASLRNWPFLICGRTGEIWKIWPRRWSAIPSG